MADLPNLLLASLVPASRKQAEQALQALSKQPSFLPGLLQLVLNHAQDRSVRLAGSVFLKNTTKSRWDDVCSYFSSDVRMLIFVFFLGRGTYS